MRWATKKNMERRWGSKYRKKFLWLPKTLKGETRWLETAYIWYFLDHRMFVSVWVAAEFVTEDYMIKEVQRMKNYYKKDDRETKGKG